MGPDERSDPNYGGFEGDLMEVRKSLVAHEAHPGMRVQVVEDSRRPTNEGMFGTVKGTFGHPDYLALDVQLENGRLELFWFHQLEKVSNTESA